MTLIEFLDTHLKLDQNTKLELDSAFETMHLKKGYNVNFPENQSKNVIFIEKGLIRTYYFKEDKDITHYFFDENAFYLQIDPVFYSRLSPYGTELIEDSVLRVAPYAVLEKFINEVQGMEDLMRLILIDYLKIFSDRLYSLQFHTAQERYNDLLHNYPDILLRAPLGQIASYLGITQQTLSVIRAKKG